MLAYFPWFKKVVKNRQQKVIISMTSYPQRFEFLSSVIDSIKNQSFLIKDIKLVLYKKHKKLYKLDIDGMNPNNDKQIFIGFITFISSLNLVKC